MKILFSLLICLFSTSGLLMAQQMLTLSCLVFFGSNSHRLSSASSSKWDSLVRSIQHRDPIGITGYADSDGDETYNNALSRKRAQVVQDYLASKGVSNNIHVDWHGELSEFSTERKKTEKAQDRRVEIFRMDPRYNDVFESFKKKYQLYRIDPTRDTLLNCAEGLVLRFGAGILEGAGSDTVTVKVQEFYSKSDFVLAGLTTQGPGNSMLESGGMVNIEAWQSGRKLDVKRGRQLEILFKNRQPSDGMQLFNASDSNGSLSWQPATSGGATPSEQTHEPTKEMMTVRYSVYDTSYVYSHYWEKGPLRITKSTVKGKTTIDTLRDESRERATLVLGSTRLGWINCDRFYNSTMPKVNVAVDFDHSMKPFVSLVFKDINSIMPCTAQASDRALFSNIPEGKEITIVGVFKSKESDRILFGMQKAISSPELQVKLDFEELSADEVKERLKQL